MLNKLGLSIVVVHGGGPRIKRELEKSNIQSKFIRGLRVTDEKIISIVEKVLIDFNWYSVSRKGTNELLLAKKLFLSEDVKYLRADCAVLLIVFISVLKCRAASSANFASVKLL